jgi:tetratricopeptide (TPR) repeat protein
MKSELRPVISLVSLIVALHLAALFLPPSLTWGFHFLKFLGPMYPVAYVLAAALLAVAALRGRLDPAVDLLAGASRRPVTLFAAALAVFAALGFVFRVDVPLLGDSWYLVKNFAGALRGTEEVLPRDEPLATWYLSAVLGLFGVRNYPEFLGAFFAGGMALGAGFLLAAFATTRVLFTDPRHRAVAFLTVCAFPAAVLFFGYVETYAAVLLMISLFVLSGLLYLRGKLGFWVVAVAFLAQALTHYLTIITFPALAYLGYLGVRGGKKNDVAWGTGAACAIFLAALFAVGFDVSNYFSQVPHKHYLPLFAPQDPVERYSSPYTLLSPFHFLDLANLAALLLTPAIGIAGVGLWYGRANARKPAAGKGTGPQIARRDILFLVGASAPPLLFGFIAKFDLGTARDWDVLAPYSYIVLLLAFAWAFRRAPGVVAARSAAVIAASTLLHSMLWWTVTGSDAAAVERFRSLMDERLTGQMGMYNANLYLSRYYRQVKKDERESAELWLRYIWLYPGDVRGFRNVLYNTQDEGPAAAAEKIRGWSRAFGHNQFTDRTMVELALELGNAALDTGAFDDAEHFYRAAIDIDPKSPAAWNNLGTVHARRERFGEAADMFSRAVDLDPGFADAWFNLGRTWLATGNVSGAREAFEQSARLGNRSAKSLLSTGTVQP